MADGDATDAPFAAPRSRGQGSMDARDLPPAPRSRTQSHARPRLLASVHTRAQVTHISAVPTHLFLDFLTLNDALSLRSAAKMFSDVLTEGVLCALALPHSALPHNAVDRTPSAATTAPPSGRRRRGSRAAADDAAIVQAQGSNAAPAPSAVARSSAFVRSVTCGGLLPSWLIAAKCYPTRAVTSLLLPHPSPCVCVCACTCVGRLAVTACAGAPSGPPRRGATMHVHADGSNQSCPHSAAIQCTNAPDSNQAMLSHAPLLAAPVVPREGGARMGDAEGAGRDRGAAARQARRIVARASTEDADAHVHTHVGEGQDAVDVDTYCRPRLALHAVRRADGTAAISVCAHMFAYFEITLRAPPVHAVCAWPCAPRSQCQFPEWYANPGASGDECRCALRHACACMCEDEVRRADRAKRMASGAEPSRALRRTACVAIGLATRSFPMSGRMPGWDSHSFGYHGDDGCMFIGSGIGMPYSSPFGCGDTVGCGVIFVTDSMGMHFFSSPAQDYADRIAAFMRCSTDALSPQAPLDIDERAQATFQLPAYRWHWQQLWDAVGRVITHREGGAQPCDAWLHFRSQLASLDYPPEHNELVASLMRYLIAGFHGPFLFFTRNGISLPVVPVPQLRPEDWYACIGLDAPFVVQANFGEVPFTYSVCSLQRQLSSIVNFRDEPTAPVWLRQRYPVQQGVPVPHGAVVAGESGVSIAPPPPSAAATAARPQPRRVSQPHLVLKPAERAMAVLTSPAAEALLVPGDEDKLGTLRKALHALPIVNRDAVASSDAGAVATAAMCLRHVLTSNLDKLSALSTPAPARSAYAMTDRSPGEPERHSSRPSSAELRHSARIASSEPKNDASDDDVESIGSDDMRLWNK